MSSVYRLFAMRVVVCRDAAGFNPSLLDRAGAARAMAEWAAIANAAQAACDMAAARVTECDPSRSATDAVAKATGTSAAKAKQRVETGERLRTHERIREAATSGRLSPDQSALISDAVAANPDSEEQLLETAATKSNAELRDECAKQKMAADPNPEATEARIHAKRCLRRWTDAEGAAHLHATGTKRDMAKLDAALEREVDKIFKQKRADGVREPYEAYQFDALINAVDKPSAASDRRPTVRHLGLLRVDWAALVRGHAEGDEACEIAGLGPIPVATARAMLGECVLKLVITKGVDVASVVHLGRGPNMAQEIALLWSQPRCTVQDCGRVHRLEVDHRHEWCKDKQTVLGNLDRLCDHHHDLKTRHGWSLVDGTGPRAFVSPDDPDHPRNKGQPP